MENPIFKTDKVLIILHILLVWHHRELQYINFFYHDQIFKRNIVRNYAKNPFLQYFLYDILKGHNCNHRVLSSVQVKVEKNHTNTCFRVPVEIASHCHVTRNYISLRGTWNTRRASSQNTYDRRSEITVLQIDRKNKQR